MGQKPKGYQHGPETPKGIRPLGRLLERQKTIVSPLSNDITRKLMLYITHHLTRLMWHSGSAYKSLNFVFTKSYLKASGHALSHQFNKIEVR
jgi:hypothetical protein